MKCRRCTFAGTAMSVVAATIAAGPSVALADVEPITIDVGTFVNTSVGVNYSGDYADYFSTSVVQGEDEYIVLSLDIAGILGTADMNRLLSISAIDTGQNSYGTLSPGADVDLMTFDGLPGDAVVDYLYEGPNDTHADEDPSNWAQRVSELDTFSGAQDQYHLTHVSLGNAGRLTATFTDPNNPHPPGDPDGDWGVDIFGPIASGLTMNFSQAGSPEFFSISIQAVPGPGSVALLLVAGAVGRRRRRP